MRCCLVPLKPIQSTLLFSLFILALFVYLAVQHERGPRNSTIRRQMALLLKESSDLITAYHHQHYRHHPMPSNFHHPLDLRRTIVETPVQIGVTPVTTPPTVDTQESAARILFNAINWTKTVPAFVSLSTHDQVKTIELSF